jgi:hypothetical protein
VTIGLARFPSYYPSEVEEGTKKALKRGHVELHPCQSEEALLLETELLAKPDPVLNVRRN